VANAITLFRIPVLVGIILLLYYGGTTARFVTVPLVIVLILMDTLDGIVARRRGESSLLGSTLDIAVDRAVEVVLWICFANLRLIPVAIPMIVVIRGALVDAFRSVGVQEGVKPFDMIRAKWARKLVASPALRMPYGVVKASPFPCWLSPWPCRALRTSPPRTGPGSWPRSCPGWRWPCA